MHNVDYSQPKLWRIAIGESTLQITALQLFKFTALKVSTKNIFYGIMANALPVWLCTPD